MQNLSLSFFFLCLVADERPESPPVLGPRLVGGSRGPRESQVASWVLEEAAEPTRLLTLVNLLLCWSLAEL